MIELRQRLWLAAAVGRDLQRDEPLHAALQRQIDRAESPFPERRQKIEVVDLLAGLQSYDSRLFAMHERRRLQLLSGAEQPPQLVGLFRKAA